MSLKKYLILSCCLLLNLCFVHSVEAQYKITIKIDGYDNDTCVLGYTVGKQNFVQQRVFEKNDAGAFVFEGEKALLGGLYSVFIKPKNQYFNFIISNDEEQKDFRMETKIVSNPGVDLPTNLKIITKSPDNEVFDAWKKFLGGLRRKSERLSKELASAKEKNDTTLVNKLTKELGGLDEEVITYQDNLLKEYPKLVTPKFLVAERQPKPPASITGRPAIYRYFKAHYFDHLDWSDERLIRTSVIKNMIETYTDKLTVQNVDSLSVACDYLIGEALRHKNKEVFQFVAVQLLNKYAKQDVICLDGVYVTIAQKYYCSGLAYWVDSAQLEGICKDAGRMAPLRCGRMAPPARLKEINDSSYVDLYAIKKPFVAVYFWDPTCGNCAKMSKALVPIYNKYKDKGFEIYGVCSKAWKEVESCRKKVKEVEMDWINTSDDPYPLAYVKKYYDLRSNPYIYLLDENKKILYKRISAEQLDQILERQFKMLEEKKK